MEHQGDAGERGGARDRERGGRIRQAGQRRLPALDRGDRGAHPGQGRVATGPTNLDEDRPLDDHRASDQRVHHRAPPGLGVAGDQRFVDQRTPGADHAVDRNGLAAGHAYDVAGVQIGDGDRRCRHARAHQARPVGADALQLGQRRGCAVSGTFLDPVPDERQRHDRGRAVGALRILSVHEPVRRVAEERERTCGGQHVETGDAASELRRGTPEHPQAGAEERGRRRHQRRSAGHAPARRALDESGHERPRRQHSGDPGTSRGALHSGPRAPSDPG